MLERKLAFLAKSLLFLILTFAFHVGPSAASVVDTPHNETNAITCGSCHSYSVWWRYSPVFATSAYPAVADAVCNQCHGSAGPAFVKAGHSTASMGVPHPVAGSWSTKCVDCHDPHLQQQVKWLPSSPVFNDGTMASGFFLVEGEMSTIQDIGDGTTTFHFGSGLAKPGWEDAADWTMKSGHDGRGLILALGYGVVEHTYEVIAASVTTATPSTLPAIGAGTITVQTGNASLPSKYENAAFGLFYGQLVKNTIDTPHSGSRSVKFLDGKDGLVTTSATPRDGVCQVCHTLTKYWHNDGDTDPSTELHNPTITCTTCHYSETGFKVSGGPHPFLGETQLCMTCHPSGDILAVHKNNCQHCHTTSPPTLADPANKTLVSAIRRGTCQDCHGEMAHPSETAHNHRQTTESCAGCHEVANATAVDALHKQGCATCHGYTGAKLNQTTVANAINTGMGGTDVNCQTCHTAAGHATETDHNHRKTVASCADCHAIATQAAIDALHQQGCGTCHGYTGAKLNQTTVAAAIATGKGASGTDVNCQTCHTVGHATETDHNHRNTVDTCAVCHPAVPADIDELHKDDCHTCHGYAGAKLDPSTVADAIADGKGLNGEDVNCQTCHTNDHKVIVDKYNAMNYLISRKAGEPWNQPCVSCHDTPALPPAHNKLGAFTPCSSCHFFITVDEGGNPVGTPGDFDSIWSVHKNDCFKCHFSARPEVKAAIEAGRVVPGTPVNCTTCHGASKHEDSTAVHNHRQKVDSCASASCHVVDTAELVDTLHKSTCTTCHGYTGAKLDPATVANAISIGKGASGTDVNCRTCHTSNGHHDSPEAANNNCTITCHAVVDHTSTVAASAACVSCHTGTAGTATGVPLSLSEASIHDACRTCHTFDANKRGVLVNFTNQKGVNGDGRLPEGQGIGGTDGGGVCTNCHTMPVITAYHHNSPRTAVGQCETCHQDPRPTWGPNSPGDNGAASGLAQARPTQMACLKCHVVFTGANMTVTKFERTDYFSYSTDWTRTTAHTIPMTGTRINNYGICLSCHYKGSTKVSESAWVSLWHAHPSRFGGLAWTFYNQGYYEYAGKTVWRGSGSLEPLPPAYPGDYAHYLPGRSKHDPADIAPQSGISGFNLFTPNYGEPRLPNIMARDYNLLSYGKDQHAFEAPAYDTPSFIRVAVPATAQLGDPASATLNSTTRSVPVFASLAPATSPSLATDSVKVKSAIYDSSGTPRLTVVASTSSDCANLTMAYGGSQISMTGAPSNCTATINNPAYPASGTTVDVTTSNPLGLNVMGYRIATPNPGTITFSASTFSVAENGSGGTATISVSRTGGSTGAVTVHYATSDGTATADTDYTATTGTLSWDNGDIDDKTFPITILDDSVVEGNETANLTLTAPTGGATLGLKNTTLLNIADDESIIAFTASTYSANENGGTMTITLSRTSSPTGGEVGVSYATADGTATAGTDYTATSGTISWVAGDMTEKTFTIPIIDNALLAADKTVNLALSAPTGGATLGTPNTAVLTIVNDETNIAFTASTYSVNENDGMVTITASRTGSSASAVGVHFATTADGTAAPDIDYTPVDGNLTWPEGDMTPKTFTLPIINNSVAAANKTVNLALTSPTGDAAALGAPNTAVLTIVDDDTNLAFTTSTYSVYEYGGTVTITASRTGLSTGEVGLHFATIAGGTAIPDIDYTPVDGNLTWPEGDMTPKTFTIPIINNSVAAAANKTVNLALSAPTGGATLGTPNTAVLTIVNEDINVALTASTYSVNENGGTATITVSRTGNSTGIVKVYYQTIDSGPNAGTAGAGSSYDYSPRAGWLIWYSGDTTDKTFTITIYDNSRGEWNKTVNLALSSPTGGATLGTPNTAVLTILENDTNINFWSSAYSVNENGGSVTITANRVGLSTGAVGVNYATADGTAIAGTDYTATSGALSWGDGELGFKTFSINIIDNSLVQGNKTVNLALTSPTGGAILRTPSTSVLTIVENDNASPTLSISEPNGTNDTVTVGDPYTIIYSLQDTDSFVQAQFAYDTDNVSANGGDIAISGCQYKAEGTNLTCTWDTTGMAPGNYYIKASTSDGVNPQVQTYSTGMITINPPPPIGVGNPLHKEGGDPGGSPTIQLQTNYSVPAGTKRLLLVAIHYQVFDPLAQVQVQVMYGGQPLTYGLGVEQEGAYRVWVGYLQESAIAIATAQQEPQLMVSMESMFESGDLGSVMFAAGSFTGVNQNVPIISMTQTASGLNNPQPDFSFEWISAVNSGRVIYFATYANESLGNTTTQTPPADYTEMYDEPTTVGATAFFSMGSGMKEITADGSERGTVTLSSPQHYGVVAISLQP